jgi:hypothetical protein
VVIWLRTALEPGGGDADIVIDLHDPNWPVIPPCDGAAEPA